MRVLDWPERLAASIESARSMPFAWGSHDCVLWACEVVQAMTGADPAATFRGAYSNLRGALDVVQRLGGGDFRTAVDAVCRAHGFAPILPALAQRGDVVLCPSGVPAWPLALGVCAGTFAWITGDAGLVRRRMADAVAAWRVG